MTYRRIAGSLAICVLLASSGCKREADTPVTVEGSGAIPTASKPTEVESTSTPPKVGELPDPDLSRLSMRLQMKIGALRQEIQTDPNDVERLGELGAFYYAQGYPEAAVNVLLRAIAASKPEFTSWYMVGRAYERLEKRADARDAYQKALTLREEGLAAQSEQQRRPYSPLNIRLAALLLDTEPARAAELLQQILDAQQNDPVALAGLGLAARAQDRPVDAEGHFRRALSIAPGYALAHRELAAVLAAQGREEDARSHRERGQTEEPFLPPQDPLERTVLRIGWELNTVLADAAEYGRTGNLDAAEKALEIARDVDPDGVHVRNGLALLKFERKQYESAAADFRALAEENPDFLAAKANLALALAALGQFEEAERLLVVVLDQAPADGPALDRYAKLMATQNRKGEALERIRRAREAQPEDPQTQLSAGLLLRGMGELDEAAVAIGKAVALEPISATAHFELGAVRRAQGDVTRAKDSWTTAIRLVPSFARARMALFSILHDARDYPAAEQLLREGLLHAPQSLELANALAWCLATSPIDEQRNPEVALQLAQKVNEATNYNNGSLLDTLAAAYAAAGQYDKAREWVAQAILLAQSANRPDVAADYRSREVLYQQDQPFREPAP